MEHPGVSRRAVLAGALAVAVPTMASCASGSDTVEGLLTTTHSEGSPRWRLSVPSERPARGLVVALHGYGGDADAAFDDLRLDLHVERTRLAVVSVDGGNTYWHARRDGTDSGAMVADDLIPLALERAGLTGGAPVATYGWSMGGFGALHLAAALGPQRIHCAVAASAALWRKASQTPQGAYDDREDFDRTTIFGKVAQLASTPVLLQCGDADPFIAANRALAPTLAKAKAVFDTGGHTDDYWRDHAGSQLDWVASTMT